MASVDNTVSSNAHSNDWTLQQQQQDTFLTFSRNLLLQTPRWKGGTMEEIWDEEAELMFGPIDNVDKKRKAHDMEDGTNSGEEEEKNQDSKKQEEMLPLCGLEDDECMLSFLQRRHKGDFERAKLSTLISVDRGYGTCEQSCTASVRFMQYDALP